MSETRRSRRPSEGGYARGEETRRRIVLAAIERFGEHGFEAASTREIAARAGVNAPALQYYFENKEGLYRACAEFLASTAWSYFEAVVERAKVVLAREAKPAELIDAFIAIQETMADRMFTTAPSELQGKHLFFVREQAGQEPPIASQILLERVRKPLNDVCAALVARVAGTADDDPVTLIRVISLYGQLIMFHTAPRSALALLGWDDFDGENGALLKATVREQTRHLLEGWSRERAAREAKAGKERPKGRRT